MPASFPYPPTSLLGRMRAHPLAMVLFGSALWAVFLFLSTLIALMLIGPLFGVQAERVGSLGPASTAAEVMAMRFWQGFMQLISFGLLAWILAIWAGNPRHELGLRPSPAGPLGLALLGSLLLLMPLQYLVIPAESFDLPPAFDAFEAYAKQLEATATELLQVLLRDQLVINLVVVAVIPAVVEELFFRGWMLRTFQRVVPVHVAIVLQAFLFSLMHLQFLGFFVRWALGVLLGYLRLWTGSLWASMLTHFINNALAVVLVWGALNGVLPAEYADPNTETPFVPAVVCGLLGIFVLRQLYRLRQPQDQPLTQPPSTLVTPHPADASAAD